MIPANHGVSFTNGVEFFQQNNEAGSIPGMKILHEEASVETDLKFEKQISPRFIL